MQDLRLIGVHEDGMHLILADADGNRFRVALDEPLRVAARSDRPRLDQQQTDSPGGLRPREVQTMIRAGLSAEEVAERAGWTAEKVHRYEGPILAERAHVAGLARQVRLRSRAGAHGPSAPTLAARVADRLASREIDEASATWDSYRSDQSDTGQKGSWTVVLYFNAGGRQRRAAWEFDPVARTILATDDEARWLSEDDDADVSGPIPATTLTPAARDTHVYDVEAEGGVGAPRRRRSGETLDLVAAMRERSSHRSRRRRSRATDVPGLDQAPDEALPLEQLAVPPEQVGPPPAAHLHPDDDPAASLTPSEPPAVAAEPEPQPAAVAEEPAVTEPDPAASEGDSSVEPPAPPPDAGPPVDAVVAVHAGPAAEPSQHGRPPGDTPKPAPPRQAKPHPPPGKPKPTEPRQAKPQPPANRPKAKAGRRSGRPSVPSWDDIVFGRKED